MLSSSGSPPPSGQSDLRRRSQIRLIEGAFLQAPFLSHPLLLLVHYGVGSKAPWSATPKDEGKRRTPRRSPRLSAQIHQTTQRFSSTCGGALRMVLTGEAN